MCKWFTSYGLIFALSIISCSSLKNIPDDGTATTVQLRSVEDQEKIPCRCRSSNNYRPVDDYPILHDIRKLRVNMHFVNNLDSTAVQKGKAARDYAYYLIEDCNKKLGRNTQMNLPPGNDTKVYEIGIRYVLVPLPDDPTKASVYEHFVEDKLAYYVKTGGNKNNYDRTLIDRAAVDPERVINIFGYVHHPDSLKTGRYSGGQAGISLGSSIKITTLAHDWWMNSTILNHEIGHTLGLSHSWIRNDGCEDTPPNNNCWEPYRTGRCKGPTSNNMMDYNNVQLAVTPCQIGKIHKSIYDDRSLGRSFLVKDHCQYNPDKSLIIKDSLILDRSFDVKGDIIVQDGGYLRLSCRIHMPKGGRIIVHAGGTLDLNGCRIHNDCGESWQGIFQKKSGRKEGKVITRGEVSIEDCHTDHSFNIRS